MAPLRISGLVATMRQVRAELASGLLPEAVPAFRERVRGTVAQVEALARAQKRTPRHLPAQSFRAYQFLKSLDLEKLPLRAAGATPPAAPAVRVRNLAAIAEKLNDQLDQLTRSGLAPGITDARVAAALLLAQQQAAAVEAICAVRGSLPAGLPAQSRRAYQWLTFLSVLEQLQD